jgi:P pilus assembly chaperone PapD
MLKSMSTGRLLFMRHLPTFIKVNFHFFCSFGLIAFTFLNPVNINAQGNLLVTPRRVVFDGTKKSIDLNLANTGQDTAIYAITLVQIRMKEDGSFETISTPDPGQNFADQYIRFFPRLVELPPNEAQVVKVQLVKTNQLAPGEYRSHFYFRSVPKAKPLGEVEAAKDTNSISVSLTSIFGITIPAIIRIGESNTKVTLSDLSFKIVNDTIPRLTLAFNRTGNMSAYGDLAVDHISKQGVITRVGIANGIAVYTPNLIRRFQFNLKKVTGIDYKSGTLRIVYSAPSDVKPARYAEAELNLN